MIINKKSVKVGDIEVYNTEIIYARVMCILSTNRIKLDEVLKYELSPRPNSLFKENGNMRLAKSKSTLKNNLQVEMSARLQVPLADGCALLCLDSSLAM